MQRLCARAFAILGAWSLPTILCLSSAAAVLDVAVQRVNAETAIRTAMGLTSVPVKEVSVRLNETLTGNVRLEEPT